MQYTDTHVRVEAVVPASTDILSYISMFGTGVVVLGPPAVKTAYYQAIEVIAQRGKNN